MGTQNNTGIFFEENPNSMWVYEPESLEIKAVNNATLGLYGYSREEMLALTIRDLRPENEIRRLLKEVGKQKRDFNDSGIWQHRKKNGDSLYVHILSYPIRWEGENCKLVVAQDVTKQKDIEQEYQTEQELLDTLVHNLPGIFFIFNQDKTIVRWNRQVTDITGYVSEEIKKMVPLDFFAKEEHSNVRSVIKKAFSKGYKEIQTNLITKKGKKIPFYFQASKINILEKPHLISVGIDITDLKTAEEKLQKLYKREKEERLRIKRISSRQKLLERVGNIFVEEHADRELALKKVAKLLVREVADSCSFDIFESDSLKRIVQEMDIAPEKAEIARQIRKKYPETLYNTDVLREVVKSGKPVLENNLTEKALKELVQNPEQFELVKKLEIRSYFILPLKVKEKVLGVVTLIILQKGRKFLKDDISFLSELASKVALHVENSLINKELQDFNKKLERKVKERTRQLENTNEELESFSYSVSHDLRAPLRAIGGYTSLLLEDYLDQLDEDGKEFLIIVNDEARRMGELIDDLLSFSRLSRKEKTGVDFPMGLLVRQCIEEVIQASPDVKPKFEVEELPEVNGDPKLLRQVWVNLIGNAVKYRREGTEPHVVIGSEWDSQKKHTVFHIKDNGVGFNMKYADKLFGVFQRLHSDSEFEGTGIGLALVRRIINRHDGEVWAEGNVNEGSIFYFSLPNNKMQPANQK